jgi:uncharacterized protein (DUF2141 family)
MTIHLKALSAPLVPLLLLSGVGLLHHPGDSGHPGLPDARSAITSGHTEAHATWQGDITLTVIVTGADKAGGTIGAALYSSADGFPNKQEKAAQTSVRPRTAPVDSVVFRGLTAGRYAVSVFHDQNSNTKLDTNLFGVPKEPWGTTGTVRPRLRAPRFDEAMINVTTDTRIEIRLER